MNLELVKIIAIAAFVFGAMTLGWSARGWKEDAVRLKEQQIVAQVREDFKKHEDAVAATLEARLAQLKANQTIIEKRYEKIVDRPVYRNECVDDDGLRLIEAARRGISPATEPTSAVPAAK